MPDLFQNLEGDITQQLTPVKQKLSLKGSYRFTECGLYMCACLKKSNTDFSSLYSALELERYDLNIGRNNSHHHTELFGEDRLIVRRGQRFDLTLYVKPDSSKFTLDDSSFSLVAKTGRPTPHGSKIAALTPNHLLLVFTSKLSLASSKRPITHQRVWHFGHLWSKPVDWWDQVERLGFLRSSWKYDPCVHNVATWRSDRAIHLDYGSAGQRDLYWRDRPSL